MTLADGGRAVLKISPHRVNRELVREAHQLQVLSDAGLPVPRVYACHPGSLDKPHTYLLMEHVEGRNLNAARQQCSAAEFDRLQEHLAELVLAIHSRTAPEYQRVTVDAGQRFSSWVEFYRHVYEPIWQEVAKSPMLPGKARKQLTRLHDRLDSLLAHEDVPRLVHWDIWSTNLLVRTDEQGQWRIAAVLDPNCKYAHAEAEIAYMELFRTVTPAFLKAYQQARKLEAAYHDVRKPVYQVYSLMNHVRLFGHEYVKPLLGAIERAAGLV